MTHTITLTTQQLNDLLDAVGKQGKKYRQLALRVNGHGHAATANRWAQLGESIKQQAIKEQAA
jgi:hypothetical protein